jgi:hypothetical protein
LERDAAAIQVEEIAAADARLDRARFQRELALMLSLPTLFAAAVAWVWQSLFG